MKTQHRFVDNLVTEWGNKAVDLISGLGYPANILRDIAANFLGDYLKDF